MRMLSARELTLLARELDAALEGCRLKKVYGLPPGGFVLRFEPPEGEERNLLIALEDTLPRVNLLGERPAPPRQPDPLVERLRRELKSARVRGVDTLPGERIVRLSLETPARAHGSDDGLRRVVVELLPRHRNLIVTDGRERIRLLLRTDAMGRGLEQGGSYVPPAPPPASAAGVGPPFAFLPQAGQGRLCSALEAWVESTAQATAAEDAERSLGLELRKRRKKEARLAAALENEVASLPDCAELRRLGDVLKVNLSGVPRGGTSVTLTDWSEGTARSVEVPLDPRLSARENVELIFKRARKAERARPRLEVRLESVRGRLHALDDLLERLKGCDDAVTLSALEAEARSSGFAPERKGGPLKGAPSGRPAPARRLPYRVFLSADGMEILVGKTAADNDQLTFKTARGNDLWLHVADYSGSHVVVRCEGEPPQETLLDAALLAVRYSAAPRGSACDVSWTRRKWVRKFRGASPGQVQLAQRRTIRSRPDPERLARLARSRGRGGGGPAGS